MDLNQASQAHADWKVKLRMAIAKKETLDAATIRVDNACALGKWLHGEGKTTHGKLKPFGDCVAKHAAFHKAAASVADAINRGDYAAAEKMLDGGTPYAQASSAVGAAILALKKEVAA